MNSTVKSSFFVSCSVTILDYFTISGYNISSCFSGWTLSLIIYWLHHCNNHIPKLNNLIYCLYFAFIKSEKKKLWIYCFVPWLIHDFMVITNNKIYCFICIQQLLHEISWLSRLIHCQHITLFQDAARDDNALIFLTSDW